MAEVLGAVASGLALAEIALKLKGLVNQISDAPATLEFLVNQVETYAGVLDGLELGENRDGGIPPSLHSSLRVAALQCQNAVDQLSLVVRDLSALSKTSSRRRKMAAIRFVLRKDSIAQFEHRLQTAVQCLALAHQLYMFAWQKTQLPDAIISRLQSQHMPSAPKASITTVGNMTGLAMNAWSEAASAGASQPISRDTALRRRTALLPDARGPEWPPEGRVDEDEDEDDTALVGPSQRPGKVHPYRKAKQFRRKLHFSTWSYSYVFEMLFQQSYTGWKASLAVYNIYDYGDSSHWEDALDFISTNEVSELYQAFERRKYTPRDRFVRPDGYTVSFAEIASAYQLWEVCNFLLDINPEVIDLRVGYTVNLPQDADCIRQQQILLKRDLLSDNARFAILAQFIGDAVSFDQLRRQCWPDDEFYHDSFLIHRNRLAWYVALDAPQCDSSPEIFRHILSPQGSLRRQDIYSGELNLQFCDDALLHAVASNVADGAWCSLENLRRKGTTTLQTSTVKKWTFIAYDIISLVDDYHVLAQAEMGGNQTALFALLFRSFKFGSERMSMHKSLRRCDIGLQAWLKMLQSSGVDLMRYGERETELVGIETFARQFEMQTDSVGCWWHDPVGIELIGFQYGPEVEDWKLWWSEPTDVFAGDFWKLIEPPYQPIPGAWVED
ncbi:hypothetical protein PFICI_12132 [Pestalotiopsis fici W106-1]|uniref:Fungal N-terminal domain-containing protein n=1 Tax=Pestalotiopsis fici (strain W106-1 / CGMCC3.15140) TaxID=1229662 RepID=W3WSB9_PESFW|nr:uncharacterized protein PFICI_12132 [Pestalotiopsis fici W106-1]ETS76745.1 hypothetical protein PFICI_12132 [Pestalotiopsis fici W106-1]